VPRINIIIPNYFYLTILRKSLERLKRTCLGTVNSTLSCIIIIFISLLMSQRWGIGLPRRLHIRTTGHNPPCGPSAGWWVLTTANAAGTNGLTCFPKHGAARSKFLVTYPMNKQRYSTSAIAHRSVFKLSTTVKFLQLIFNFNSFVIKHKWNEMRANEGTNKKYFKLITIHSQGHFLIKY
jgi:hypothetical protein